MREFRWTAAEVSRALGEEPAPGDEAVAYAGVSTDTRRIGAGTLFVALAGEKFDAHDFLARAAEAGAAAAVVSRVPEQSLGLRFFVVDDTRVALGLLGRHRRRAFEGKVIGVCGSNGKTTTKELLRAALGSVLRVHATEANLNNQVGVPLTLLSLPDDADAAVVEMGTNEPGEIAALTRIVEPDIGIITSIGEEHLEGFGDVEGVFREETALLEGLPAGSVAIVAEEPEALPKRAVELLGGGRVRVAGLGEGAGLRPEGEIEVLPDGGTRWGWAGARVHLPLPGRHNVRNALVALGVARELGVSAEDAARGIAAMTRPKLRGEWHEVGRMRVLADCYNSNPPSLAAAVDILATLPAGEGEKVAVVGTMRELGTQAEAIHRRAAEEIAARVGQGVDRVVATGDFVPAFAPLKERLGERLVSVEDPVEAYDAARSFLKGGETVLLKGSRGVQLERWLPLLERDFGSA